MIPTLQPSQQIQLKYIFGLNSNIRNNIYFIDDSRIIYPAGYNIVCYSLTDKTQTYFQGVEGYRGFSCITLSPMKRFLACGVKAEKPAILIYDMVSQKKKKTLTFNDASIKEWTSVAFGPGVEAKTLVSLSGGGANDAYLCYWQMDTMRCLASIKVTSNMADIFEVSFQPNDATFMACIGKSVFKCYKFQQMEGEQKGYSLKCLTNTLNKAPADLSMNYSCHAWMIHHPETLVVCTSIGEIFLCNEQGDYEQSLKNSPIHITKQQSMIEVIQPMQRGFAVGGDNSAIFTYNGEYELVHQLFVKSISDIKNQIKGISFTPISEETIIVTLSSNLIYSLKLTRESALLEEQQQFEMVSLPFHSCPPPAAIPGQQPPSSINGMDVCVRKPLIVTCGSDKYIRVWNYEDRSIEAYRSFNEEALCVSIHPSGFHIVVGLSDRLRFMNICVHNNQIKHYREIVPFRQCKEIKFSNGGQYFAAVNATNATQQQVIHIYRFYTGDNPPNLLFKGHTGRIRGIMWSKDDTILATCGSDGMVCTWRVSADSTGQRLIEIHPKNVQFTGVTLTADLKLAYAVGNDRYLREITQDSQEVKRNVDVVLSQVAFPSSNKLLFASVCDDRHSGAVRCYKYPFTGPSGGQFNEYQAHDERGIEKMRITADDQYVITAGKDGVIIVYEIKDKDARGMKLKEGYSRPADEIIVTRSDLEDLKNTKDQCKASLADLNAPQNVISISSKEDQIKQLQEKLQTLKQQGRQNQELQAEKKRDLQKKIQEDLKQMRDQFENEIQQLEQNQQDKVNKEAERYDKTKHDKELAQNKNDKEWKKMEREHEEEIKKLEKDYELRLMDDRDQRLRMEVQYRKEKEKYEETLKQIKIETDGEIAALEEQNQQQILNKTDQGLKAKSEVSMTKKKIQAIQLEEERQNEKHKELCEQKKQLEEQNQLLKTQIDEQLKQIQEKDKTIGDRERKIYELKKRSQELEKFKFVLDHKIKELKRDIGPREEEINTMKKQTNNMDQKLKGYAQMNNYLGNVVDALDKEQKIMKNSIKSQRQIISYQNVKIKKFKDRVFQAVQFIQNYQRLKEEAQSIFDEFHKDDVKPVQINEDIFAEYQSQKLYLEKSVEGLKKNLSEDEDIHKAENIRIMRGNVKLISEINKLRKKKKEIKSSHNNNKETKGDKQGTRDAGDPTANQQKLQILEKQKAEIQILQQELQALEAELRVISH